MQNHAFKRYSLLFLALLWLFSFSAEAAAQVSGICPLPAELRIKVNGTSYGFNETVVVDEDTEFNVDFVAAPFVGNTATKDTSPANEIRVADIISNIGQFDSSTTNPKDWQPDHMHNTDPTFFQHICPRPSPVDKSCWTAPNGRDDIGDSHHWTTPGWKIKEVNFSYVTDDFDIGNNDAETGTNPNLNKYKYNVPSVPDAYSFRANLSMRWEWNSALSHRWIHTGFVDNQGSTDADGNETGDTKCDICQSTDGSGAIRDIPFTAKTSYINPPLSVPIGSNGSIMWGHEHVENCDGAVPKGRMDFLNISALRDPVSNTLGKVLTARIRVVVKDKKNIAHVQTGFGGDNILKGQNGQRVSATDDHKKLTVRFVDNAPNAILSKLENATIMSASNLPANADFKDDNFKMIFWYEWPIYQYASYSLFKYFDKDPVTGANVGPEHNFCNVIYSPMFVWKKGKVWNKMTDFLKDTHSDGPVTAKLFKDGNELTTDPKKDPEFVVYEGTFPIDYLMKGLDASQEDIVAWHYAKTSWGDGFGNPAYDKDKDASPLYNTFKPGGKDVKDYFKYPPINYKNGKGPLKYFFEIRDCSNNGGGKDETNFNCAETYFTDFPTEPAKTYLHPQLRFNSDSVKYLVKSSQMPITSLIPNDGTQVSTIDIPGGNSSYCASEDYADDPVQKKWKDCAYIKNVLNPNVDSPSSNIINYYQAWGKIEIEDKIKPNLGIYIKNTVKNSTRRIYMEDGTETLYYRGAASKLDKFTRANTDTNPEARWATIDRPDKYNYFLLPSGFTPNPNPPANSAGNFDVPFDDMRDEWVFDQIPKNSSNKLYEGDELQQDTKKEGYGVGKDIQLIVKHQDLCEPGVDPYFVPYYAYDNIDGQRYPKTTGQDFNLDDWYKGVAADNNSHNDPNNPVFADNKINLGFVTWAIKDDNYDQATSDSIYKVGNYYTYPKLTVSNVNCDWDCTPLNGGKEISLTYAVIDKNKNHRKIKMHLFVAPTDMSITTIEKHEKRNE